MKNISARDYDVFMPEFDFEATPTGDDFFITNDGDAFSWSTKGQTMKVGMEGIAQAASLISEYAKQNNASGNIWLLDGDKRKYVGKI